MNFECFWIFLDKVHIFEENYEYLFLTALDDLDQIANELLFKNREKIQKFPTKSVLN